MSNLSPHTWEEYTAPAGSKYWPRGPRGPEIILPIAMKTFRCSVCGATTGNPKDDRAGRCRSAKKRARINPP